MIQKHPDAIAIQDGYGSKLTYRDMGRRIEGIAHKLRAISVAPNCIVGVFQMPSADWVCSLLAILRIGAVYMPLDLRSSIPRIRRIVRISSPAAIIVDPETAGHVEDISSSGCSIINTSQVTNSYSCTVNEAEAESRAVILFTSGSTGEPKGIMLSHSNLRAHFEGFFHTWKLGSTTGVVLQQIAYTFDLSISQIFIALASGGSLYVAPAEARGDPQALTKLMQQHGVTYTLATPSELEMWFRFASENLRNCPSWKTASFGGELASPSLIDSFQKLGRKDLRLFNVYGPAEASISAANGEVLYHNKHVDLSLPSQVLPNYTAYIADDELNPVPIGVPGEIILGGAGIAMGYLGLDDETASKFIASPIRREPGLINSDRVYRTGDRGRLLENGSLICEGRLEGDTQVKIRGIRIELGELESVLVNEGVGAISQAIATLKDDLLIAYVLFSNDTSRPDQDAILKRLGQHLPLPSYMCPAFIFRIEELPLTVHGKVDRKSIKNLSLPATVHLSNDRQQRALSTTEFSLAALWNRVFAHDVAGIHPNTNFFKVGGNSLLLVKLQHLIRQEMGVALPLVQLMNGTELTKMADLIESYKQMRIINWDEEIGSCTVHHASSPRTTDKHKSNHLRVVMTGATGQLGRRMLEQLKASDRISVITCLVRSSSMANYEKLFSTSAKIRTIVTDLEEPNAGLSMSDFEDLSENTDVILHCAANRSFWDSYETVCPVNVKAAKTLARMAAFNNAHVHLLSSGAVSAFESGKEASLPRPPTDGSDGYVASKWVVERYFENAANECGIPVTIHRPTKADAANGGMNDADVVIEELLNVAREMGARPDFTGVRGKVDLAPVSNIAAAVLASILQDDDSHGIDVIEHTATIRADVDDFVHREAVVAKLPAMPILQWIGEAKKAGFSHMFTAQDLVMTDLDGRSLVSRR